MEEPNKASVYPDESGKKRWIAAMRGRPWGRKSVKLPSCLLGIHKERSRSGGVVRTPQRACSWKRCGLSPRAKTNQDRPGEEVGVCIDSTGATRCSVPADTAFSPRVGGHSAQKGLP